VGAIVIDPAAATPERVLAVLEAWARARGLFLTAESLPAKTGEWRIGVGWRPNAASTVLFGDGGSDHLWGDVPPLVALAWALAVEADERVDVGRCRRCRGRGEWSWWEQGQTTPKWMAWAMLTDWDHGSALLNANRSGVAKALDGAPWALGTPLRVIRHGYPGNGSGLAPYAWLCALSGPCPDCTGTGIERREAARLVLDAAPRDGVVGSMYQRKLAERSAAEHLADLRRGATVEVIESPLHGAPPGHKLWAYRWSEPGDPTSIAALTVHAEQLVHTTPPCSTCGGSGKDVVALSQSDLSLVNAEGHAEGPQPQRMGTVKSITIKSITITSKCLRCNGKTIDAAGQRQRDRGELLMHLLERWTAGHWDGSEVACRMLEPGKL